jgi:ethanolamine utilization protein EutM
MTNSIGIIESKGLVALVEAADVILKNSPIKILGVKKLENGIVSLSVFGESEYVKSAVITATNAGRRVGEIYAYSVVDDPNEELLKIISDLFELKGEEFPKTEKVMSKQDQTEEDQEIKKERNTSQIKPPKIKSKKTAFLKAEESKRIKIIKSKPAGSTEKENEITKINKPDENLSTIERLRKEALGISVKIKEKNSTLDNIKEIDKSSETSISSKVDFEAIKEMNVHKLRNYARGFINFPIKGRQISRANRDELVDLFKTIN